MYASWSSWTRRSSGEDLVVDDRVDPDPVDVVHGVERVAFDVVGRRAEVEGPPFEEHHRDVDASVPRSGSAIAETVQEGLVEAVEIELRLAVLGLARSGPRPWLRGHAEVEVAAGGLEPELLPTPEPDEVVAGSSRKSRYPP
jgi:hypothetical protein